MKTQYLTKDDFLKKIINFEKEPYSWNFLGEKPCLINFYTSWCKPCTKIADVLDELAEEYNSLIDVYKIDAEKEHELASIFGIRSIPTFLFCPVDDNPKTINGAIPKEQFIEIIDRILLTHNQAK